MAVLRLGERLAHPRRGGKPEFKEGRCPPLDGASCWPSSICVHELPLALVELKLNVPWATLAADSVIFLNLG